jgi:hypothetical protein
MQTTQAKRKHFSRALFLCVPIVVVSLAGPFTQSAKRKQNDPVASIGSARAADAPPLTLSHAFIVVTTGAPERRALEKAGFRIAPTVNRHDGQGTASVTAELLNGFLELTYPDPTVPVSPALQAGAEKFRLRSAWRETGYSPIAIAFDRTPATPEKFPFPTWRISPEWMEKGGHGLVKFEVGRQWLLEVTLDKGKQRKTKNLQPDLPMVIHY